MAGWGSIPWGSGPWGDSAAGSDISATLTSTGGLTCTLVAFGGVAATLPSTAGLTGTLGGLGGLAATLTSVAGLSATMGADFYFSAAFASTSSLAATLTRIGAFAATLGSTSTLVATMVTSGGGVRATYLFGMPIPTLGISAGVDATPSGTKNLFDFDLIPGVELVPRVSSRSFLAVPAGATTEVEIQLLNPTTEAVQESMIVTLTPGLNAAQIPAILKPAGRRKLHAVARMTSGTATGALDGTTIGFEVKGGGVTRFWHLWRPGNSQLSWGGAGAGDEARANLTVGPLDSGVVAYFDFSLIPIGAAVTIIMAGMARDADVTMNIRVCEVANVATPAGAVVMTSSWSGSFGGVGNPYSDAKSFTNVYAGVKAINLTGYRTGGPTGTGVLISSSFIMKY